MTNAAQEELARTIRRYWADKGFAVKVWVEPTSGYMPPQMTNRGMYEVFVPGLKTNTLEIRSNLLNGLPRQ